MGDRPVTQHPRLIIIDDREEFARSLEAHLTGVPVSFLVAEPRSIWQLGDVDAICVPVPHAERWGAEPVVGRVQLLASGAGDRAGGMARYVLTGVAGNVGDDVGSADFLSAALAMMFAVVRGHNASSPDQIESVAMWSSAFNPSALSPEQIGRLLRRAYR